MKRPAGASFGFGGKLVAFTNHRSPAADQASGASSLVFNRATISVSQLVTEQELVQRSEAFEAALAGGNKDVLQGFCVDKAATAQVDAPGGAGRGGAPTPLLVFDKEIRCHRCIPAAFKTSCFLPMSP